MAYALESGALRVLLSGVCTELPDIHSQASATCWMDQAGDTGSAHPQSSYLSLERLGLRLHILFRDLGILLKVIKVVDNKGMALVQLVASQLVDCGLRLLRARPSRLKRVEPSCLA